MLVVGGDELPGIDLAVGSAAVLPVERGDQLVSREDLLIAVRPAEPCQVVERGTRLAQRDLRMRRWRRGTREERCAERVGLVRGSAWPGAVRASAAETRMCVSRSASRSSGVGQLGFQNCAWVRSESTTRSASRRPSRLRSRQYWSLYSASRSHRLPSRAAAGWSGTARL
jgi:hypothetical protein